MFLHVINVTNIVDSITGFSGSCIMIVDSHWVQLVLCLFGKYPYPNYVQITLMKLQWLQYYYLGLGFIFVSLLVSRWIIDHFNSAF